MLYSELIKIRLKIHFGWSSEIQQKN